MSVTTPSAVSNRVSSTFVFGTYRRVTWYSAAGAMRKNPPCSQSRSRAKTGLASKRWNAHQSIDPSRETSAPEWQSESSAYAEIGGYGSPIGVSFAQRGG